MTTPSSHASRGDTEALAASESLRSALSDQLARGGADVLSLALHAGRLLALHGASSLLVTRIGEELCSAHDVARAALLEGFARGREELTRKHLLDRMAAPIVAAGEETYAVFCGFEADDDVDLSEWADGIVRDLRKLGAKRIFVDGSTVAASKVRDAAALVGIDSPPPNAPAPSPAGPRGTSATTTGEKPATWRRFWPFRSGHRKE